MIATDSSYVGTFYPRTYSSPWSRLSIASFSRWCRRCPTEAAYYQDKSRPETLKQIEFMEEFDPFFEIYQRDPRWNTLAKAVIGEEAITKGSKWFNKPPKTEHPTPPHQDNYYFKLSPPNVASLWLAIDPINEENGCLRYIPGSHRRGIRPHARTSILGFSQGITDYSTSDEEAEVTARYAARRCGRSSRRSHSPRRSKSLCYLSTSCLCHGFRGRKL